MTADTDRMAASIASARPANLGLPLIAASCIGLSLIAGIIIGRATAPEAMTWADLEALVCPTPTDTLPDFGGKGD